MDPTMTAVSEIVARPLLPIEIIVALALIAAVAVGAALLKGLRGAWLRLGAALALILALLEPGVVEEERSGLADVVALVIDESESQTIEDRAEAAAAAAAEIQAQIEELSAAQGGVAPIELRTAVAQGDGAEGTRLMAALAEATSDVAPDRLAGAILITDGAVSDAERRPPSLSRAGDDPPPVHVLLTGREGEFDRRLVLESAAGFGLVGETSPLRLRVEESGAAPSGLGPPRVRVLVDGELAAAGFAPIGRSIDFDVELTHAGPTVVELRLDPAEGELTERNNVAAFTINGVRDRLRVLLVSGEPHAGERVWRNLLKSDPSVDLVHFTILRPPRKQSMATVTELALIPFPTRELFEVKLEEFDLIVFDRYRRWGILESRYIQNIADYVRGGGAVLVSTGPAFATGESIYRSPLADVLPAVPTYDVREGAFIPTITEIGFRHPVTRTLPGRGAPTIPPEWGRWFRHVDVEADRGDVVMSGAEERPLLILDRVGDGAGREGRVALLASDHAWLWARGYDGGGPQAELLRRLAHWLMREPELEEESLTAHPSAGGFAVERRSLAIGPKSVRIEAPDGEVTEIPLAPASDGLWRAVVESEALGPHRITDAPDSVITTPAEADDGAGAEEEREPLSAIAVVGPPAPQEFADPVSTGRLLAPLAAETGGAIIRLAAAGAPDLRRIREGRTAEGSGWIGLARREAFDVTGVSLSPLAPSWVFFALAALFAVGAWRLEGR